MSKCIWLLLPLLLGASSVALAGHGYLANNALAFFGGLLGTSAALIFGAVVNGRWRKVFTPLAFAILTSVVFLSVDNYLAKRGAATIPDAEEIRPALSYRAAAGNPAAFKLWWDIYLDEWTKNRSSVVQYLPPGGPLRHVLKPGSMGRFFLSDVSINDYGFRGPPLARNKGERYRIVAVGASTTEGATILPNDRPWPEVLEGFIRRRLSCPRPVEVLNAGIQGYDVKDNLVRLESRVLPLEPDLIISYQDYMVFNIEGTYFLPRGPLRIVPVDALPKYQVRPSRLLAALEHRIRLAALERSFPVDETNTYHALYERMIEMTCGAGSKLVLASPTMAVTPDSPREVINFYDRAFPDVRRRMEANQLNRRLLLELGRKHPDAAVIDVAPGLHGAYDGKYLDLFHFTQWGRNTLAWNMFNGLLPVLTRDLGCTPVDGLPVPPPEVAVDPVTAEQMELLTRWMHNRHLSLADLAIENLAPDNSSGFSQIEGPYPQWQIPCRFRWIVEPTATIRFRAGEKDNAGGVVLTWRMLSHAAPQKVVLSLDETPLATREWDAAGTWQDLVATLPTGMTPGWHVLRLTVTNFIQYPGDSRKLYVMAGPLVVERDKGEPASSASRN